MTIDGKIIPFRRSPKPVSGVGLRFAQFPRFAREYGETPPGAPKRSTPSLVTILPSPPRD